MTTREDLYLKRLNDSSVTTPPPVTQKEKILAELSGTDGLGIELPAVTSADDGKVLTVADGQWALGNASGGSSGGGVFAVGMTVLDDSTFELDKTWQEIHDAMQSKFCYVKLAGEQQHLITDVYDMMGTYGVNITKAGENKTLSTASFRTSTANGYPRYTVE